MAQRSMERLIHERPMGRTSCQSEQQKIGQENNGMDTKRGNRIKGRSKRRWRDDIEEKAGSTWTRVAQDRQAWKQLWRPPASSGMTG